MKNSQKMALEIHMAEKIFLDRCIDTEKDATAQFIFGRFLAHDFGREYQVEVIIGSQVFAAHLKLKKK